jgi:RNA polymerase sigma-70 factor (ECF subfamily)
MDKATFLQLIQEHQGILYKISASYCRNVSDREDLMQEMIYQLWRSAERFDANFKFSTWMYRIALNVAISFYRKTGALGVRLSLDASFGDAGTFSDAGTFGDAGTFSEAASFAGGASFADVENYAGNGSRGDDLLAERIELLQRFIASLGELDRALVILYLEERPYREIADILGLTETNVATKLSRIKGRLKQQFLMTGRG